MEQPIIFPPLIGHCTHNVTGPLKAQVAFNRRFHHNRALFSRKNRDKLGTKPEDQSRARRTTVAPFWGEFFNTTKGSFAVFPRITTGAHTHPFCPISRILSLHISSGPEQTGTLVRNWSVLKTTTPEGNFGGWVLQDFRGCCVKAC